MSNKITVMTADEVRACKLAATKRALMGDNVACHNGARSAVHADRKRADRNRRLNRRERRELAD